MVRIPGKRAVLLTLCLLPYVTAQPSQSSKTTTTSTRIGVVCTKAGNIFSSLLGSCICEPCHVCELAEYSNSCDYKQQEGLDLSDGSDLMTVQPLLKPTDWFLTEEEITASRGGSPRTDLATYTTGNVVDTYITTEEFFDATFKDLTSTTAGDRVMLAGWSTDLIPFQPKVDRGKKSRFNSVVEGVIQRGSSFHALIWANLLEQRQNAKARDAINAIPASPVSGDKPVFLFDDRARTVLSSHHQKTLVIASRNSTGIDEHPVAFVGGNDITSDRWDTVYHNESPLRKSTGVKVKYDGWLDGHVRIHGPAAKDVAANFIGRWNSNYKPAQSLDTKLRGFKNPSYSKLAPLNYTSSRTSSSLGRQSIQIVRTFSCQYKHYDEFAPQGENTLFQALIKALKNAKNFIYIEDQYFILVPELLDAVLQVMPTLQRLIVVVQRPGLDVKSGGYEKYLFDMIAPIQKLYPNKFQIYTTKSSLNLYIHTKLVIIDDVFVTVSSANWNRRSMTSDSEMAANIIDEDSVDSPDGVTVLRTARDFRIRKFHEMTGLSYDELDAMTIIEAANQLDMAAVDESTIIEAFQVEEQAYFAAFTDVLREQVDPQDTCT
ncbi:PLD-like domain [Phytophthora infestans]|uniref:phospholipase D n=1 Tax=Phytophthora infestans TaxID=4787 RepID=A0A833WG90_PHYIN|nr:PLD-like domain [Phytophthora infestans]